MLLQRILMASRPKLITGALKGNDRSHGGDGDRGFNIIIGPGYISDYISI